MGTKKDKRSIVTYLDFIHKYNIYNLRVININHRSVTIVGGEIYLYSNDRYIPKGRLYKILPFLTKRIVDVHPLRRYLSDEVKGIFPVTLGDGQNVIIPLSASLSERIKDNRIGLTDRYYKIKICLLDIEGVKHFATWGYEYNPSEDVILQ